MCSVRQHGQHPPLCWRKNLLLDNSSLEVVSPGLQFVMAGPVNGREDEAHVLFGCCAAADEDGQAWCRALGVPARPRDREILVVVKLKEACAQFEGGRMGGRFKSSSPEKREPRNPQPLHTSQCP